MDLALDEEMAAHLKEIVRIGKSKNEWADIESCDQFQSDHYCGGFDASDMAFTFSFFAEDGREFWFYFDLAIVSQALNADHFCFKAHLAET